jgi:hypothetical protein
MNAFIVTESFCRVSVKKKVIKCLIWLKIVRKIFGQFEQNLANGGQSLEKVNMQKMYCIVFKKVANCFLD